MSRLSFNNDEIKIYGDQVEDHEIIKDIIGTVEQEDAFYILDVGNVIAKHEALISKMPRVEPFFAIKTNPDPTVIKVLATLNGSFDCASKGEIQQVMAFGVPGEKIVFAHPIKPPSHIKYAKKVGVEKLTVDSEEELMKIKALFPEAKIIIRIRCDAAKAKIIIRIRCDATIAECQFGLKYGCDPEEEAPGLIRKTKDLGLDLHGFSFHVGSRCGETAAYSRGVDFCINLIKLATSIGCKGIKMIDIGGGFPGESRSNIDKFIEEINKAIDALEPSIKVISEPGRYYVSSAFSSATNVQGKKTVIEGNKKQFMYYINDGVYGSFLDVILLGSGKTPVPLNKPTSDEKYITKIWGPTLDNLDYVIEDTLLPELRVGDWLIWTDMGAYTRCLSTCFNGLSPPVVYPFIRESACLSSFVSLKPSGDTAEGVSRLVSVIGKQPLFTVLKVGENGRSSKSS